jgi:two-component system response regulator HupR/HoxA
MAARKDEERNDMADLNKSVVLVLDETETISEITAFIEPGDQFTIAGFADPGQAERFAQSEPVDVVITDCQLPASNGLQFLKRMKEIRPETSRILLTGLCDASFAIKAINEVALFQYLAKPIDGEQLLLVVQSGAERCRLLRELHQRVGELDSAHAVIKNAQNRLLHVFL